MHCVWGGGGGSVEILHDVRRLIWAFIGCKFDKYTNLMRWFKFCMCLQEVKWTIKREKNVVVFYFYFIWHVSGFLRVDVLW